MTVIGDHYGLYGRILPPTADLASDFGSDEIDKLEVLMTMEELFGLRFDSGAAESVKTLGDIVTLVEEHLALQENSSQPSEGS